MDKKETTTSIRIDTKIWNDFKIYCIKNNISMGKKLEQMIKDLWE